MFDIRYFLTPNTEHRISNTKPNVGVNIPYTPSEDANNGQNNSNYELKHPRQPHTVLPHPNTPVFQRHMLPKLLRQGLMIKIRAQIKSEQKSTLQNQAFAESAHAPGMFDHVFTSFLRPKACHDVTHVQSGIEQKNVTRSLQRFITRPAVQRRRVAMLRRPEPGCSQTEIDNTPTEVHLMKSAAFSRSAPHAHCSDQYVGCGPAAQYPHTSFGALKTVFVPVAEGSLRGKGLDGEDGQEEKGIAHGLLYCSQQPGRRFG